VEGTDGTSEESEEVMTKSRMWLLLWIRKIETGEKRKKLRGEMFCGIVKMNVKVASDDKFMRCGGCEGVKRIEIFKENGVRPQMGGRRRKAVNVKDRYL